MQEDVCQGDGLDLYAYCGNNPVIYYDPSGYGPRSKQAKEFMMDPNNYYIETEAKILKNGRNHQLVIWV